MIDGNEKELFWNDLLNTVSTGQLVPIVGEALLVVNNRSTAIPDYPVRTLYELLAEVIAKRHHLTLEDGQQLNLSAVLSRHPSFFKNRPRVFQEVSDEVGNLKPSIPEPLLQLAGIKELTLFVSTTFDGLLQDALDQVRFGGEQKTKVITYSYLRDLDKRQVGAIFAELQEENVPVVVQLFGDYRKPREYALSEVEKVEFMYALRNGGPGVNLVLSELRKRPALMLGNCFPDWLARMFLRMIRTRLSDNGLQQYVSESATVVDPMFRLFFCSLTQNTDVVADQHPVEFVSELARRWDAHDRIRKRIGAKLPSKAGRSAPRFEVFISYARTDAEGNEARDAIVALAIKNALQKNGIAAWIDSEQLKGGQNWEETLQGYIESCNLFMPLISQTTEARDRGIFVKEWKWAVDAAEEHKSWKRAFLFPVVIDKLRAADAAGVPREFKEIQITSMRTDSPDELFLMAVKEALGLTTHDQL